MTPEREAEILRDFEAKFGQKSDHEFSPLWNARLEGYLSAHTDSQMARDAGRWNALLTCKRIRILGRSISEQSGYAHFGAEFWTHHSDTTADPIYATETLTLFAEAAIKEQTT